MGVLLKPPMLLDLAQIMVSIAWWQVKADAHAITSIRRSLCTENEDSGPVCYFLSADFVRKRVNLALLSGGALDSTALTVRFVVAGWVVCERVVGEIPQVRAQAIILYPERQEEAQMRRRHMGH